ncbi:hypothetical protein FOQG_09914 [Fusarium oxysporum f. sp. raphani 54005]|uniref:Uncharacterized protein n=1 Tax=Fusarium oxysporum f. sp. raphani 54005 TaxID=1089458 RepID=X0C5Z4_FUSOX|nr:hypothetical protein FOQG_09914 [Fusarium oxysporum f. sp. raphani 54005]KAJ4031605.1 hypothetical protein NW753_013421 [Fusarium oxysporum]KAJ4054596.1 hypothetical protein NW763_008158 [Fusarium oxysporum]KAJ4073523.1 hypothetical protein NW756_014229 [Fusarium oxysporum]KAJ4107701.1 hypothetical protein NW769_008662 [Fusarium oxysporum]
MASSGRQTRLVAIDGQLGLVHRAPPVPVPPVGAGAADIILDTEGVQLKEAVGKTARTLGIETSVSSYRALALSVIEDYPLKRELIAFVDGETEDPHESLVPIDAFAADNDRADWHTHCHDMTRIWRDFRTKVASASNGQVAIDEMAAPSGPLKSRATFLWHYPTDTSPHKIFSHVMDPGSASLKVQSIKNGMRRDLKTLDLIPIRVPYKVTGPEWEETYKEQWPAIWQACIDLTKELVKDDRFIFAVGKEVFPALKGICKSLGLTLEYLELDVQTKMWEKSPRIYIARDSAGNIQKVIFWTFHGQFSFANKKANVGAVWDLLYNAGYELAGVPVLNYGYFEYKAGATTRRLWANVTSQVGKITDRDMYNALMTKENAEHKICSVELVLECFPALIKKEPGLADRIKSAVSEKGYSPLYPILQFFQTQELPKILATKRSRPSRSDSPPRKRMALNDGQKRGHATKRAQLLSKYDALLNSFEARQVEASRFDPKKPAEHARALPRLDEIKQLRADEDFKRLSTKLSFWVTFFSEEYPRGLRWSLDGGPAITQPDPFANTTHPGIKLLDISYFRNKSIRVEACGPLPEDDGEDEE